jgi:L-ascorbate metabolism protein UlaG (beta-lactamase superfamily)
LLSFAALVALSLPGSPASSHDSAEARYLGNEGVLVSRGSTKVLFDAFYAESFAGQYTLVPSALESAMMSGEAPFDGVDAIFISHIHPDHFNSRKTIAYMRAHPNVRLYAGMDVVGAIRAADASSDPLMQRVVAVHVPPGGEAARFAVEGLAVEAFSIPHSGEGPSPHYAFRVTLDDRTVLHLGDADEDERHYVPYQGDFDAKRTDLALAPTWIVASEAGKRVLKQRIKPDAVIAIHAEDRHRKGADAHKAELGADVFLEPGETRIIGSPRA